jgi:mRNA interferase HigB
MKLAGRKLLEEFCLQHSDARKQLNVWIAEVEDAEWKTTQDIKDRYGQASFLANNHVVFNIKGNSYRLVVQVSFKNQGVLIKRIGTHAEYNKWEL